MMVTIPFSASAPVPETEALLPERMMEAEAFRVSAEEETEANIGVWGMRHKRYLKQNHKVRYYNLLTSGKLNSYLADIEQQAQDLFLRLVKGLAEKENVTEELKATDMMLWVQKMNNIRNRAMEIVNEEIIYTV